MLSPDSVPARPTGHHRGLGGDERQQVAGQDEGTRTGEPDPEQGTAARRTIRPTGCRSAW